MVLKNRKYTPQEMIQIGMGFFLLGIFLNMIADGRIIGAFFANLITDKTLLATIQGVAAGISIPILCASIYFNVRGLILLRARK